MPEIVVKPLTKALWPELEELFGPERGADGGCWCMWWRLPRGAWYGLGKAGRKAAFKDLVGRGAPTGVLALADGRAVGWCAVAPRSAYPVLQRSRVAKPLDEKSPTWFISCFYVKAGHRRRGLMESLIGGAVRLATGKGAAVIEACPQDLSGSDSRYDLFVGVQSVFARCGFVEVARRGRFRPLMRYRPRAGRKKPT